MSMDSDRPLQYGLAGALAAVLAIAGLAPLPHRTPPPPPAEYAPPAFASIGDAWDLAAHYPKGCRGVDLNKDGSWSPTGCPVDILPVR